MIIYIHEYPVYALWEYTNLYNIMYSNESCQYRVPYTFEYE